MFMTPRSHEDPDEDLLDRVGRGDEPALRMLIAGKLGRIALGGAVLGARTLEVATMPGQNYFGRKLRFAFLLAGLSVALSGCVVAPVGGGWCFYHPYRCR